MIGNCASMLLFHFHHHLRPFPLPSVIENRRSGRGRPGGRTAAVCVPLEAEPPRTNQAPNKNGEGEHHDHQGCKYLPVHMSTINFRPYCAITIFGTCYSAGKQPRLIYAASPRWQDGFFAAAIPPEQQCPPSPPPSGPALRTGALSPPPPSWFKTDGQNSRLRSRRGPLATAPSRSRAELVHEGLFQASISIRGRSWRTLIFPQLPVESADGACYSPPYETTRGDITGGARVAEVPSFRETQLHQRSEACRCRGAFSRLRRSRHLE